MKKLYNWLDKNISLLVTIALFILTNIPAFLWENIIVGIDLQHEIKVRAWSILFEIILAMPYLWLRKHLRGKLHGITKTRKMKLYLADTLALFIIFVSLYVVKFFIFNAIGWLDKESLQIGIYTAIGFSILFGRLMGYILDRTEKYFRIRWSRKIKRKLKKYN
jgi:hypothetical protein